MKIFRFFMTKKGTFGTWRERRKEFFGVGKAEKIY